MLTRDENFNFFSGNKSSILAVLPPLNICNKYIFKSVIEDYLRFADI